MQKETKILIADDHPIFRHGLAQIIERREGLSVTCEASDGQEALEKIGNYGAEVAIIDIDMPVLDGIETARKLKDLHPETLVVFLTMHKDKSILRSMESLNVRGYVLKDSAMNEIVTCIEKVLDGGAYLSPALEDLASAKADPGFDTKFVPALEGLTKTEKKVLSLITESRTNKEIAEELFISIRTVETHRYNICTKLGLNGSHALFKFAVKNKQKIQSRLDG